jgi:hypothetical protein
MGRSSYTTRAESGFKGLKYFFTRFSRIFRVKSHQILVSSAS